MRRVRLLLILSVLCAGPVLALPVVPAGVVPVDQVLVPGVGGDFGGATAFDACGSLVEKREIGRRQSRLGVAEFMHGEPEALGDGQQQQLEAAVIASEQIAPPLGEDEPVKEGTIEADHAQAGNEVFKLFVEGDTSVSSEPITTPPRFLPAAWYIVDPETEKLEEGADVGTAIALWRFRSTVREAENTFGPLIGLKSIGFGWVFRLKDSSFMMGLGAVVKTQALFDPEEELRLMPAVTLSLRREGGAE
jgi:hypothetical protein